MKTSPTSIAKGTPPRLRIELFRDPIGNWFACVENIYIGGLSSQHTSTYTTPQEAIDAASALLEARPR